MRTSLTASLSLAALTVGLLTMGACLPDPTPVETPSQGPTNDTPMSAAEVTRTNLQIALSTPCPEEDSTGCYWDASVRGNGAGVSFVAYTDYRGEQVTLQIG